jgi:hypothetical protein
MQGTCSDTMACRSHDGGGEKRTSFLSFAYHNCKGKIIFVVGIEQDIMGCIVQGHSPCWNQHQGLYQAGVRTPP